MDGTLEYDNCKCIFLNKYYRIPIRFSLKFVPRSLIDNNPALAQVMSWRRTHTTIIWTNAVPIYWRIYAALGGDALIDLHQFSQLNSSQLKSIP